jgi:hypothetical protein
MSASRAGDTPARDKQVAAASKYLGQLAALVGQDITLQLASATSLTKTRHAVISLGHHAAALSAPTLKVLHALGFSRAQIKKLNAQSRSLHLPARVNLASLVAPSALISAERKLEQALLNDAKNPAPNAFPKLPAQFP